MSGLSQLQRGILRLALTVNMHTQGGVARVKGGASVPGYRVPTVDYAGPKDLRLPLVLWAVGGLMPTENRRGFFTHNAESRSIKAANVRAMARLEARGLLVLAPLPARYPRTYHSDAGYVLTAEGLAAAGIEPIHLPLLAEACELFGITHRAVYGLYEHGMDSRRRAGLISAMQRLLDNSYRVTHVTNAVTTATGTDNRKANGYRLVDVSHAVAVERQHQVSRCNGYRDVDIANAVTVTDESTATDVAPCDTGNRCEVPS